VRIFCFIFVVYILVLVVQPCQDAFASVDSQDRNTMVAANTDNSSPADPTTDACSPFCVCSCCSHPAATRFSTQGVPKEIEHVSITSAVANYTNPYAKTFHDSIWQPPKA
jgi:hypothetical protein